MADNPFQPLNNTALRLPRAHTRSHSRASSRSPERRSLFFTHELDPLLNNLSPQSTLQALSTIDSVPTDEKTAQDLLAKSIAEVSTAERALGIRAAVAAQKLREWHLEITSWDWPSGADVRLGKGFIPPVKRGDNTAVKLHESPSAAREDFMDDYLGSLPVSLVENYVSRIDEIKDSMDALDVDELKEHVLNAHIPSRSRPSSSNSVACAAPQRLSYVQLSDFTAVITATILQALPWLSRLNMLLNTWDVRIVVLWQIPGLLEILKTTRTAIDASMESLNSQTPPSEDDPLFSHSSFRAARQNLEHLVVLAGSKIDRILDSLEGREDSLPETWIDDMESIEADFGNWVVEAEKLAIRNEWSRMNPQPDNTHTVQKDEPAMKNLEGRDEIKNPATPQPTDNCSSNPLGDVTGQDVTAIPSVSEPGLTSGPTSPLDAAGIERTTDQVPNSPSSVSEKCNEKLPEESRGHKHLSQTESDNEDGESITSSDSSSSSAALPNPSSVSDDSITSRNAFLETSIVQNDHVQSLDHSSPSLVDVKGSNSEPEVRKSESCPHSPTPTDSESGSSEVNSTDISITVDLHSPQPPKLDEFSEVLREDRSSVPNQQDGKLIEKRDFYTSSLAGSTHTDEPDLADVPPSDEERQTKVLSHRTTSSSIDSSARPSPEINVTSPGQSDDDEEISPRNNSFCGERDWSANPTDAPASTTSAVPPFKHDSQVPPKKLRHKPGPLNLAAITSKSHRRSVSGDSLASDCMSGASSPEIQDALTATSHGSPMVVEATSPWTQSKYTFAKPSRTNSAQTIQGPGLYRRTTEPPSSTESLELNRTTSLPLQRFIDDYHGHDGNEILKASRPAEIKRASVASIEVRPKTELKSIVVTRKGSSSSISDAKTTPALRQSTSNLSIGYSDTREKAIIEEEDTSLSPRPNDSVENLSVRRDSSAEEQSPLLRVFDRRQRATYSPTSPVSPVSPVIPRRSSKRLSKRPDSKSSGSLGQRSNNQDPTSPALAPPPNISPLTPVNTNTKPNPAKSSEDRLEEQINSILTTIPAKIKLGAAPEQKIDAPSSLASSGKGDSFGSASPRSTPTRSSTPTPSLTLTPAFGRTKRAHAFSEEPSVRLYHLHRGGKTAPVKLFVRPVGENGERVMVRVGGGWADLGEYLREYTIHHRHRTVSDGRFDVQTLPANSSPAYSSPASTITPTTNNGRSTPISRPGSALSVSARPSSSLAVRKTRKSTISTAETPSLTSANVQRIPEDPPPLPSIPRRHRPSMSSTTSAGLTSAVGDSPHSSVATPNTGMHSTPLGLSGPKPKARHASMTPENEAWVEGVIGQARKTSSSLKPKRSIPGFRSSRFMLGKDDAASSGKSSNETKTRSVSDIGTRGLNRRVFLRGLGKEKGKEKD